MKIGRVAPSDVPITEDIVLTGKTLEDDPSSDSDKPTLNKSETRQLVRDATFGFEGIYILPGPLPSR